MKSGVSSPLLRFRLGISVSTSLSAASFALLSRNILMYGVHFVVIDVSEALLLPKIHSGIDNALIGSYSIDPVRFSWSATRSVILFRLSCTGPEQRYFDLRFISLELRLSVYFVFKLEAESGLSPSHPQHIAANHPRHDP